MNIGDKVTLKPGDIKVHIYVRPDSNGREERLVLDPEVMLEGIEWRKTGGWGWPNTPNSHKLFARLKRAIEDCKVYYDCVVARTHGSVTGKESIYLQMKSRVGRCINADLKRLGY